MKFATKATLWIVGIILALTVIGGIVGLARGWFQAGADIVSPQNVKRQHAQVIGKYEDMIAAADNVCSVQEAGETTSDGRSVTFVESPTLAYEATFRDIVADYNSSIDNLFEAGIVAPAGYPTSVELKQLDTEDWCTISDQIKGMK